MSFVVLDAVDCGDPWVIQRGEHLGLSLKPLQALFVLSELVREDLDRDLPPKLRVLRPVDLAHPALADGLENLVVGESFGRPYRWAPENTIRSAN